MSYDVVILPSYEQAENWRKQRASVQGGGLFAQRVTTVPNWIADLWELHGDGRQIVSSMQRQIVMRAAFDREMGEFGIVSAPGIDAVLRFSPGLVSLASSCARDAFGLTSFEQAVDEAELGGSSVGLTGEETLFLRVLARYRKLVEACGFVEMGTAMSLLADRADAVFPRALRVLMAQAGPLDWCVSEFFDRCPQLSLEVERAMGEDGIGRMSDGVDLRFAFPSGGYAQPAMVRDLICESFVDAPQSCERSVVVACKDPLKMFGQIEGFLAEAGIGGSVQASKPFAETTFGGQLFAMVHADREGQLNREALSDAVRPPFSGFSNAQAIQIDKELRANRIAQLEECLLQLRASSDLFSQWEELAGDPEADILLGVFEQIAMGAPNRSQAWRAEQVSAARALHSCTMAARLARVEMSACHDVLGRTQIGVSCGLMQDGCAQRVVVTTLAKAAQMAEGSCHTLILCDMTSDDYPVSNKDDAASTLFSKLGLQRADSALARQRREFARLQSLPSAQLVCMRPLNDCDGAPSDASAVLQELVDAYSCDSDEFGPLDEGFGIPESFLPGIVQRGEELLFANALAMGAEGKQEPQCEDDPRDIGDVSDEMAMLVPTARKGTGGNGFSSFSPSPSQVEAYLECPYKWFAQRRLGVEELGEGFGPLERGTFCHAVLQKFYEAFAAEGYRKVSSENLARARELMREIADATAQDQYGLEPGSGRYVAANQIEHREVESQKTMLVDYLDYEAGFLPGFWPGYLEFEITPDDAIEYAGHLFMGKVDRVDVDGKGNAVAIDYKGSLNDGHFIFGKGKDDPGKVQARMYAAAVGKKLGLNVVGAFYVSYGKKKGCAGAFDGRIVETAHLPLCDTKKNQCALQSAPIEEACNDFSQLTFADVLVETESLVASAIGGMERGFVRPEPCDKKACKYCPVTHCPKRGA